MQELIKNTVQEVRDKIGKNLVTMNQCLTDAVVQEGEYLSGFEPCLYKFLSEL